MRRRILGFIVAIVLGIAAGLIYGWLINPPSPSSASLLQLRSDYRTDAVLMVAEIYQNEQDPMMAAARLTELGSERPVRMVQDAIVSAQSFGYDYRDIATLASLAQALQTIQGGE